MKRSSFLALSILLCTLLQGQTPDYSYGEWKQVPIILSQIIPPTFANKDYNITKFGATPGGTKKCTSAIQKAIDKCSASGGGRVVVPKGVFLTGAIHLKSNVNLYISEGATLLFSTDLNDYLPIVLTRFEGMDCKNYSPFIYAYGQTNIAITGTGTLDGNTGNKERWDSWKAAEKKPECGRNVLMKMVEDNVPAEKRIFGNDVLEERLRPSFVQPYNCKNILIEGIKIRNSPMWELNPVFCENVTIKDVDINTHWHNNDGCDPESCKNVLIKNCIFDTGDDCIAIKSGRNNDGRLFNVPSENIIIQGCTMKDGHGGVTLGSELSGGIRNVFVEDCIMNSSNLDRALRIKTNWTRGGVVENVYMRNCHIEKVAYEFFQTDMTYEEGHTGGFQPTVQNVFIENVTVNSCPKMFTLKCYEDSPVTNVLLNNCKFNAATTLGVLQNVRGIQLINTVLNGENPLLPSVNQASSPEYKHAEVFDNQSGWGWSNVVPSFEGNGYMEVMDADNSIIYPIADAPLEKNEKYILTLRYVNTSNEPQQVDVFAKGDNTTSKIKVGTLTLPVQKEWSTISSDVEFPSKTKEFVLVSSKGIGIDEYKAVIKGNQ